VFDAPLGEAGVAAAAAAAAPPSPLFFLFRMLMLLFFPSKKRKNEMQTRRFFDIDARFRAVASLIVHSFLISSPINEGPNNYLRNS